jgi:hypothetical protein
VKPKPRTLVNPIVVTAIEPLEHGHNRCVTVMDTRDGTQYEMVYGDSVSERTIRIMAPLLVSKTKQKRGVKADW